MKPFIALSSGGVACSKCYTPIMLSPVDNKQGLYKFTENWFRFIEFIVVFTFLYSFYLDTRSGVLLIITAISQLLISIYITYKTLDYFSENLWLHQNKSPLVMAIIFMLVSATVWVIINQLLGLIVNDFAMIKNSK